MEAQMKKVSLETPLKQDEDPLVDLSRVPNDADDKSDTGRPTTDHEAEGWRATPPLKP
jgi:hypothetical protein